MNNLPSTQGRPGAARLDFDQIKRLAVGNWVDILAAAGVPRDVLSKRHKPCPVCGGTDRFSFKDKEGRGTFVCNQHRPQGGDGFHLLADWLQSDFVGAASFAADWLRVPAVNHARPVASFRPVATPEPKQNGTSPQKQRLIAQRIKTLWKQAQPITPGCPVALYLASRGLRLGHYPAVLRWHSALPYWVPQESGTPIKLGEFNAMVAAIQAPDGRCIALHQTYLTPEGKKADVPSVKKWTSTAGSAKGAAVKLFAPDTRLAIGEGIETTLAIHTANGWPVWAGVSAWGLEHIELPGEVVEVLICADHDEAGQKAAEKLASRLIAEGRTVRLLVPSEPGTDWLDVLNNGCTDTASDRGEDKDCSNEHE